MIVSFTETQKTAKLNCLKSDIQYWHPVPRIGKDDNSYGHPQMIHFNRPVPQNYLLLHKRCIL